MHCIEIARGRRLAASGEGRSLREAAGLSLSDLAPDIGVDSGTLSRIERGLSTPRAGTAERYAAVLDRIAREAL